MENRELNIWDMFWFICTKWRKIIISMIVFAIVLGAFSYYRSYMAVQAELQKQTETELKDIELSEEEKYYVDSYLGYKDVYDKQVEYNAESKIMNLKANEFYLLSLNYYIDNDYIVEYPMVNKFNNVNAISYAYKSIIADAGLGEAVDCNNEYGAIEAEENAVFTISIYGESEEECYALSEQVKGIVKEAYSTVEKQFGEHKVYDIAETCVLTSDIDMLDFQKMSIDKLNAYGKLVMDMEAKFTANAKLYVELYEKQMKKENDSQIGADRESLTLKAGVSKKYILLGAIIGAFLAVGLYALGYIFNSKIQYEDDFQKLYGLHVIGKVKSENKKKLFAFLDSFIDKMRNANMVVLSEEERINMLIGALLLQAKNHNLKELVLSGRLYTDKQKELVKRISSDLKENGIGVKCTDSVLYDIKALEQNEQAKNIVLVECAGSAKYEWIKQEIMNNRFCGVEILGAVIIK